METKKEKMNFFKRLKKAIFELEDYGYFLGERLTVAFKYFFVLVILMSIIVSLAATYKSGKMYSKAYDYIENELPDFEFKDNKLNFNQYVEGYDYDFNFGIIINTADNLSKEKINEYTKRIFNRGNGIVLLKDKAYYIANKSEVEIIYSKLVAEDETLTETLKNKESLINTINAVNIKGIILVIIFIIQFMNLITYNVINILSDVCIVAIFGLIAAKICGVNFKMNPMIVLAIYSLSLSIVLQGIYDSVFITTGFYIENFKTIYLIIAYIYMIAAIFMIKYDLIKQTEELQKIIEVQKQVKKELEENEEKEEQEKKKEEKDKTEEENDVTNKEPLIPENREPDGSEI